MWRVVVVCVLVCAFLSSAKASADCDDKAKIVYSRDERPLGTANPARTQTFTIRASGAWTRHTERTVAGAAPKIDDEKGCLADPRVKLVSAAIAKAQWKTAKAARKCRVAPFSHVTYAAPAKKKSIAHDEPCGDPFDAGTAALIACAEASIDPALKDDDVKRSCAQ